MKLTEKQESIIHRFGYQTSLDFLSHYPVRYEFLFEKPFSKWESGDTVVFKGVLASDFKTFRFGKNQSKTSFTVLFDDRVVDVVIFNRQYLKQSHYQSHIVVIGTVQDNLSIVAKSITNKPLEETAGIHPIYPLKENIKQYEVRRLMKKILKETVLEDVVPDVFTKRYKLMHHHDALHAIHFPSSKLMIEQALRTLKYEEFLIFHLVNYLNTQDHTFGIVKETNQDTLKKRIKALPFSLTADQIFTLEEILHDLSASKQMNRLLQGDVGSGKTVVALLASLSVIDNGFQVAFMVPTEILLGQHERTLNAMFPNLKYAVLSSSSENKNEILKQISNKEVDLILGTHALFQSDVEFNNLGLVIIDEQHRFGVMQRRKLIEKGSHVDTLMLSATPIPRSLASSLYFDLDVSTIQTYPKHKLENKTVLIKENSFRSVMDDVLKRLEEKDQIYVVCPSIEDSQNLGYRNVMDVYHALSKEFKNYRVSYIHSKLEPKEKEAIMKRFSMHDIDILISTTIIEVGIDVPNANTMIIYNADMFGLSTLHQLRGRIGRGIKQGICYILSDNENEETQYRLQELVKTNDGFKLSMIDLRLRGMGDLLGESQSGLPSFILGDIEHDGKILAQAKLDAKIISKDLDNTCFNRIVNISKQIKMVYN